MDIQLNVVNNSTARHIEKKVFPERPVKAVRKKSSSNSAPEGFSIKFGAPQKAKAVVLRRRVAKKQETKPDAPPPPQDPPLAPPSQPNVYKHSLKQPQDDIILNTIPGSPAAIKGPKLSRSDRRNRKVDKLRLNPFTGKGIADKSLPHPRKENIRPKKKPSKPTIKQVQLFTDNPETKLLGQRLVKPRTEKLFIGTPVSSLDIHPHSIKNLADVLNITELTAVQQKTIPEALKGRDILVRSQTGSGKTLAYALPIVQKLQDIRPKLTRDNGILAVVIVPTRELALQTYELFVKLLKPFTWIVPGVLTGGERRKAEKARLRKGINILVGTPGRLVDHLLHTESFKLNRAKFLVIDEGDRLLEMGYERDVKQIVEAIDEQRKAITPEDGPLDNLQRLILSATLTPAVQKLAGLTLKEPLYIDNSNEDPSTLPNSSANGEPPDDDENGILVIPENLQLSYVVTPTKLRLVTLSGLLAKELEKTNFKAMIFMSTMEMVNFHHDLMNEQLTQKVLDDEDEPNENEVDEGDPLLKGLRFFKLHGSMTQTDRHGVFNAFREAKSGVLLATDVAGRGIDVPEVHLVIQYSPPQNISDFVHRVGRTARAGKSGRAVLFLTPSETGFVRVLEDKRIRISQADMNIYLNALVAADVEAKNIQEAASNLQHKFQELIAEDKEMHSKACKAFVSWVKFYSTFPKKLKSIFNIKSAHMGHFAKSFGLKDEPSSFAKQHTVPKAPPPTNRLTYTERDPERIKEEKKKTKKRLYATTVTGAIPDKLKQFAYNSKVLATSEYDSGLPPIKRRK